MNRDAPHDLVNRTPDEDLPAARRYWESLAVSPAHTAALSAAPDDEPVTEADAVVILAAGDEVRDAKVVPHEEILREFGLR